MHTSPDLLKPYNELYNLNFLGLWVKYLIAAFQINSTEQYVPVMLFLIMLYKVVMYSLSTDMDEILEFESGRQYFPLHYGIQLSTSNFIPCGCNSQM